MRCRCLAAAIGLLLSSATSLHSQSSWDRYIPGTLSAVATHVQTDLVRALDTTGIGHVLAESDYPTRAKVVYAGEWRSITHAARDVIESFVSATGLDSQVVSYFREEALFVEDGVRHWLPVQAPVAGRIRAELTPGVSVTVFAMWVGAQQFGARLRSVFIVNHFVTSELVREIDLGLHGRIALGAELVQRDRILLRTEGGLRSLRPGTFSGAESIAVELTENHQVREIHFGYEAGTDFDRYVGNLIQLFGAPAERTRTPTERGWVEVARWQDDHTIEEIEQTVTDGVSRVRLRLLDRRLSGR